MPTLSRQARRGRWTPSSPRVLVPAAPSARQRAEAEPASVEPVTEQPSKQALRAQRQREGRGPARPIRPPRPRPPGLAAVRGSRASLPKATPTRAAVPSSRAGGHPLTNAAANARLRDYESRVQKAFDRIVPVLKEIASHRCESDFTDRAQSIARAELGVELPNRLLDDAWITGLDMRRLFAWTLFETYRQISDEFFLDDPLGGREGSELQSFLLDCGFHLMDITPCADGRLAHAISYVLRLPYGAVRRKSYAGTKFDIEGTVEKWVETELARFREGRPNTADAPTRYLKTVIYHFSSVDPTHQGCAAHGSDDAAAARSGWERLMAFRQAIENGFCCGASVDLLLVGMDTDTDAIRVHVPDASGQCDLERWIDAAKVYEITRGMGSRDDARQRVAELVRAHAPGSPPADGMVALIARLIENNCSQIEYVREHHGGSYRSIGHAERFIGVGIGFEEIQLRNLTYFAYLATVEEGAADLDVGIRIFSGLNIDHGLPIPIVIRFDYHGGVPGARERAIAHCQRIAAALSARYPDLRSRGLLHCLRAVRDCDSAAPIEILGSSLDPAPAQGH